LSWDKVCDKLVTWLKESVEQSKARGAIFGMSGGLDSSVVSVLCKKAFKDDVLGLIMPCHSDDKDAKDALQVAEEFGIRHKVITLDNIYDNMLELLDSSEDKVLKANIKPRLRMTVLYYYAGLNNYLVVGSENKSEISVGYFTKHCGSDLLPLGNLVKSSVRELGIRLNIPKAIIDKTPSAGLWPGQTDESEMGVSYAQLERYLLTGKAESQDIAQRIETLIANSEHKRNLPPIPMV